MSGASSVTDMPPPILPHSSLVGPMPWMIAVMTALAMLGLAAAIALTPAATALSGQIAGRATIQVMDADPLVRRANVAAIRAMLRDAPYVGAVQLVSEEDMQALTRQWLGAEAAQSGIVLPALIDVDLVSSSSADGMDRLRDDVRAVTDSVRVTPHADWLGPVAGLMRVLGWSALAVAIMFLAVAAAVAVLAARGALASQRASIDVLHLVGATDVQISRLFQRQIARGAMIGAAAGGLAGLTMIAVIGWQLRLVTSSLATGGGVAAYLWVLALPPLVVGIAVLAARQAVLHNLRTIA